MSNLKKRLDALEDAATKPEPAHFVIFWDNGDGTCTNTETGEVITPGPDFILLRWPEDMGTEDEPTQPSA